VFAFILRLLSSEVKKWNYTKLLILSVVVIVAAAAVFVVVVFFLCTLFVTWSLT
jgi:hypothetical protein